jgi:septal ring factor EnvC (AmiA/AmiB activator)
MNTKKPFNKLCGFMLENFNIELSCEQEHRIRSFFQKELDEVYHTLEEIETERDQYEKEVSELESSLKDTRAKLVEVRRERNYLKKDWLAQSRINSQLRMDAIKLIGGLKKQIGRLKPEPK